MTRYKLINREQAINQEIIITDFDMESIRKFYTFHSLNEKCSKSESVYLGEILNDSLLLYLGDDLLTKSTKEFHSFFKNNWYPVIHQLYILKFTIGFAPVKIIWKEELNEFVPIVMGKYKYKYK